MLKLFKELKLEKLYIWLAVPIGILFVFLNPPFQVPDEAAHYFKSLSIAKGQFTCATQATAPANYMSLPDDTVLVKIQSEHNKKISGSALYRTLTTGASQENVPVTRAICSAPPIGYVTQALGLKIGILTGAPPLVAFYLGRLLTLLTVITMLYLAIRVAPFGKIVFLIVSMLPMTMQQTASFSYDALHIGLILLFTAYVLKLAVSKEKLSRREATVLLLLSLIALNTKPGYFLLAFLVFLLPQAKFISVRQYWTYGVGFIVAHASFFLLLRRLFTEIGTGGFSKHIDPYVQLLGVLSHPWWFPFQVLQTLYGRPIYYFETLIFKPGWLNSSLPALWYIFMGVAIVLLLRSVAEKNLLTHKQRLILFLVFLAQLLLVFFAMYLVWTPVDGKHVVGVQGRYLLVLLPLFILSFYKSEFRFRSVWVKNNLPLALGIFLVTSFFFAFLHIVGLYYKGLANYF